MKKRPKKGGEKQQRGDDDDGADKRTATLDADGESTAEVPVAPAPPMAGENMPKPIDVSEEVMVTGLASSYRHGRRFSIAAGTGVSIVNGNTDVTGQLVLRYERGVGAGLVGAEGSLWLVGGVHGEGSLLATGSRGITRRLELGIGAGLHLTGSAAGPALDLALRMPLMRDLRLFLRYDGALLLHDGAKDGQNAVSAGIEATW
jgi:hypothetical protein